MATQDELLALADRCEREEPGRFLDAKIELLFVEHDGQAFPHPDGWVLGGRAQPVKARPFTTSLDAAVTLVPDIDWGVEWALEAVHGGACIYVWTDHPTAESTFRQSPLMPTRKEAFAWLPRLICATALRARAAMEHADG